MPYIREHRRDSLLEAGGLEGHFNTENVGELNYVITHAVKTYFQRKGNNYQAVNDVLGALEGAKLEFYRRVAAPYEDKKIQENGDVYA